jgi:hypothetical protein
MKTHIRNFVGLALLFIAASIGGQFAIESARAAFWQWSKTAINNSVADPSINWAEGMSPSAVNDSARAMMARLAEQGQDTSGALTTAGGPTAYTVATNQGFPTPTPNDGQVIGVNFNVTNAANPTLAVDAGGTAYPIQQAAGVAVPALYLVAGNPYTMKFTAASSAWILRNVSNVSIYDSAPIGVVLPYTLASVPNANWAFANGQCLSQATYAFYYAALGSPGTGGCAAGQFRIIDLQGRVAAGVDSMGGATATNRLTSAATGCGTAMNVIGATCANGSEQHVMAIAELVAHNHYAPIADPGHYHGMSLADPGHFHATSTADPTHAHTAGIYDPGHTHGVTGGVYGSSNLVYQYYQGGSQGGGPAAITISAAGTGVLVNGGVQGNNATYAAGTGVYMNSGNGANTVGSKATGAYVTSANGTNLTSTAGVGVYVSGAAANYTSNAGSSTPFPVIQHTMALSYIVRVQ